MRNLKKFLALVLAMMMAFSLMTTVSASSFKDGEDITPAYTDAVDVLTELGVINGYNAADGTTTFAPKANITRGEVAAILYRIVTGDVGNDNVHLYEGYSEYADVPASGVWYTPYINYCANNALILGVGGGNFEPKENVTGYQALVMILRAMGYNDPKEFSSSDWKLKASGYGRRLGITTNIPEGSLGGAATREMVAEIMYEAIQAPTVSYSNLYGYTTNLLVAAGTKGVKQVADAGATTTTATLQAEEIVYNRSIPSTLLYEVFDVVGLGEGRDNYGRPTILLYGDGPYDNVIHGTKYVAGGDADNKTWTVEDPNKATAGIVSSGDFRDDVIGDPVLYTVVRTPKYTFYKAISECELTKIINNDKSIKWSKIDEYVNGNHVAARTGDLDATHTTVNTIGAQGRTTEVFNVDGYWTFVYYDTLMGLVTDVTPVTKDTAGHVMQDATLTVLVNSGADGLTSGSGTEDADNVSVEFSSKTNYSQKVGDLVLLTTWGMKDAVADEGNDNGAATGISAVARLAHTTLQEGYLETPSPKADDSDSVPDAIADFKVETPKIKAADGSYDTPNNVFAVDLVGTPSEKQVTVTGTVGAFTLKTGILAGNDTYMANNAYLDNHTIDEYFAKDASGDDRSLTNSKIGRSFKLYLDKNNNIVGMVESQSDNVGVITSAEPVRIATGKWAIEIEMFMVDGSSKSFRLLNDENPVGSYNYYDKQSAADTGIGTHNEDVAVGDLVKLRAITKDGQTYWAVADWDDDKFSAVANDNFKTGVTNTITDVENDDGSEQPLVNDDTIFFVTEYDFHYNNGQLDQGAIADPTYRVYKGFKNVPTIKGSTGDDNIHYEIMDADKGYVLIKADDLSDAYNQVKQDTITVDDSILVVAPIATYADYAEYSVIRNGKMDVLKVANINDNTGTGLNEKIEDARDDNKLIWVTSENAKGYATDISDVDTIAASGADPVEKQIAISNTFKVAATANASVIPGGTGVTYSKGVLTISNGTNTSYLTVADNCVVKIVNKDLNTTYDATLDSIKQYQGTDDIVIELDSFGYAAYIYIMD